MLDGQRKVREPSQSVLERRRSEAIVGSHLPTLATLQSQVARLTAQTTHSLRMGEKPERQLREADEALRRIREAREALAKAGSPQDGRVADVEKSLLSLYQRAARVRAMIERQTRVPQASAPPARPNGQLRP